MVNIMQQLIQYVEQLIPRGMDFILSLAIGIIVFFVGSKAYKKTIENCAPLDGEEGDGVGE